MQDFQLNRVALEEGAGAEASPAGARPKKKNRKTYDLTAADKFWQKHKGRSVPVDQGTVCLSLSLLNSQKKIPQKVEGRYTLGTRQYNVDNYMISQLILFLDTPID